MRQTGHWLETGEGMSDSYDGPPIPPEFAQFTPRTARALTRGGYRCLLDVWVASDDELLALRNFGMLSLAEVRATGP